MNHPFYIDRQVFPGYTRSPAIYDFDQMRRISAPSDADGEGDWCIEIHWNTDVEDGVLAIPFNSAEHRDDCFVAMRKAIFAARQIDEEIPD